MESGSGTKQKKRKSQGGKSSASPADIAEAAESPPANRQKSLSASAAGLAEVLDSETKPKKKRRSIGGKSPASAADIAEVPERPPAPDFAEVLESPPAPPQKKKKKQASAVAAQNKALPLANLSLDDQKLDAEELPDLLVAASHGDAGAVTASLSDSDALAAVTRGRYSALHLAVAGGHVDVVAALLKAKAEPGAVTAFGHTALHLAVLSSGPPKCLELLLQAQANLHARDGFACTPGCSALELGSACGASKSMIAVLTEAAKTVPPAKQSKEKLIPQDTESIWALLMSESAS